MITRQKIYAILRKAGHKAAKWETSGMIRGWGEYSNGPRVRTPTDGSLIVCYETGHGAHALERAANAMRNYIAPTLEAAGVKGEWVDEGEWRVSQ